MTYAIELAAVTMYIPCVVRVHRQIGGHRLHDFLAVY